MSCPTTIFELKNFCQTTQIPEPPTLTFLIQATNPNPEEPIGLDQVNIEFEIL